MIKKKWQIYLGIHFAAWVMLFGMGFTVGSAIVSERALATLVGPIMFLSIFLFLLLLDIRNANKYGYVNACFEQWQKNKTAKDKEAKKKR